MEQPKKTESGRAGKRRVVLAEVAGFCYGVRRAIALTEATRRERAGVVTTLGPLVHNLQVTEVLRAQGIETATEPEQVSEGVLVLSAHGTPPAVRSRAEAQRLEVLDGTCPFVTRVHRMARQLFEQGYQVLIVGDRDHTEVRGILGALEPLGGTAQVVGSVEDLQSLALGRRVGIVSQTTQQSAVYAQIVAHVCRRTADVRAVNTICNATDELQDAALRLARCVDVVIVVGGRQSANTRRLRQLCEDAGTPAYQVETPDDIQEAWLEGAEAVGLTAGASTPDEMLEAVARCLNNGDLPQDWRLRHPDTCAS